MPSQVDNWDCPKLRKPFLGSNHGCFNTADECKTLLAIFLTLGLRFLCRHISLLHGMLSKFNPRVGSSLSRSLMSLHSSKLVLWFRCQGRTHLFSMKSPLRIIKVKCESTSIENWGLKAERFESMRIENDAKCKFQRLVSHQFLLG